MRMIITVLIRNLWLWAELDVVRDDFCCPAHDAVLIVPASGFQSPFHKSERTLRKVGARELRKLSPRDDVVKFGTLLLRSGTVGPDSVRGDAERDYRLDRKSTRLNSSHLG